MRNTAEKKHTSLKPPKNAECIITAYERLQGSSVPLPDIRTSSKKHWGSQNAARGTQTPWMEQLGQPTTSKGSTSASTEGRGARWIPLGELPRDGQWGIMSLQLVLPKPKCMPYTSLLGAAAGCQHPRGICRPPLHSLLQQCCYHNSSAGASPPMLTAPITARSARQQVLV